MNNTLNTQQEQSPLATGTYDIVSFDEPNMMATIEYTVPLFEETKDTQVTLLINDIAYPMKQRSLGKYATTLTLPIFETHGAIQYCISQNNTNTFTEENNIVLDWLYQSIFPIAYVDENNINISSSKKQNMP